MNATVLSVPEAPATRSRPANHETRRWIEEDVIGAVLDNPDLLPRMRYVCRARDFQTPEHRALFAVMTAPTPPEGPPAIPELREALSPLLPALKRIRQHRDYGHFDVLLTRLVEARRV